MLFEDTLGSLEGGVSWDGYVRCDASSLPGWPGGSVRVDSGDAEEDVGLTNSEGFWWVGSPGGGLSDNHSAAEFLHDVNKLFCGASGCSAGQHDQTLLGAVPCALGRGWHGGRTGLKLKKM